MGSVWMAIPKCCSKIHSPKREVCAGRAVSTATVPAGAVCRRGWRGQKHPLPLLRLQTLKQEGKKLHTSEQPQPKSLQHEAGQHVEVAPS